jgi:hypothetical protein
MPIILMSVIFKEGEGILSIGTSPSHTVKGGPL